MSLLAVSGVRSVSPRQLPSFWTSQNRPASGAQSDGGEATHVEDRAIRRCPDAGGASFTDIRCGAPDTGLAQAVCGLPGCSCFCCGWVRGRSCRLTQARDETFFRLGLVTARKAAVGRLSITQLLERRQPRVQRPLVAVPQHLVNFVAELF